MSESTRLIIEVSEEKSISPLPSIERLKVMAQAMRAAHDIGSSVVEYGDKQDRENAAIVVTAILSAVTTVIRRGTLS